MSVVAEPRSRSPLETPLVFGVRGLVEKELRARSRGVRPALLLTAYLGFLALAVAGFLAIVTQVGVTMPPNVGAQLYSTLVVVSVILVAFITPALTAGTISGERERRTLDLLLVTRSSALGVAAGKLAGSLVYVIFLMVASLPAFALIYLFGGIPLHYLALALVIAILIALVHASLGLLFSSVLKRTALATALTYLVVIILVFGIPLGSFIATIVTASQAASSSSFSFGPSSSGASHGGTLVPTSSLRGRTIMSGAPPPGFVAASPLTAVAFVLPGTSTGIGGPMLVGDILRIGIGGLRTTSMPFSAGSTLSPRITYVVGGDPSSGQVEIIEAWSPWLVYVVGSLLFTVLCVLLSAVALAPVKPWRAWRLRRRRSRLAEPST